MLSQQWWRSPGKEGSHFLPSSSLFHPNEKQDVIVSTVCWSAMGLFLLYLTWVFGPLPMLKLYGVPYLVSKNVQGYHQLHLTKLWLQFTSHCICRFLLQVFIMWLDLVTYLHHHGHAQKLPWYRGKVRPCPLISQRILRLFVFTS